MVEKEKKQIFISLSLSLNYLVAHLILKIRSPHRSLDLNPIEMVCHELKQFLRSLILSFKVLLNKIYSKLPYKFFYNHLCKIIFSLLVSVCFNYSL
ncbi:hypothetical protein BpHYR1_000184 [Brachionus plicatilis]|uniref:Uncharacterized protein n=1 Tax=Brachionus plicatilis TaxID=10195 RepID=A0A3M7R4A3_BRAPC|nr:hypothetical protein BpHYR1_000184 [Brachionus plicatilis]